MATNNTLIPTSTIGSYAPPSWLCVALDSIARGEFGETDVEETLNDAVRIAITDQEQAGIDIVTEGEMRRQDFVLGFYDLLTGIAEQPAPRTKGPDGHDQRGKWLALEPIKAPQGLGIIKEFVFAQTQTTKPIKVTCPGPFTLSGRIQTGDVYKDRIEVAYVLSEIVNTELKSLVDAGAPFIQLDEPSYAVYPDRPQEFVQLFNKVVEDVNAKIGLHICFGNYRGRAVGKRQYRPLFPHILDANFDQLALEFANREMVEIELWSEFPSDKELAAGLIDVKNYYVETPEDVATRLRTVLAHVEPDKLSITPDCGFSQTARWAAFAKLKTMVAGTEIVRRELMG
jgi:5-methyltetrahydropteroyltriglutamate--homocysteine methyltransferase